MTLPQEYADLELLVISWLRAETGRPASLTLVDFSSTAPRNRITAASGLDDTVTESVLVDVESFGRSREEAKDLAFASRLAMLRLQGDISGGWLVDRVRVAVRPTRRSYDNPDVHRVVATYRVEIRCR